MNNADVQSLRSAGALGLGLLLIVFSLWAVGCGEAESGVDHVSTAPATQPASSDGIEDVRDADEANVDTAREDLVEVVVNGRKYMVRPETAKKIAENDAKIADSLRAMEESHQELQEMIELQKKAERSIGAAEKTLEEVKRENEAARREVDYKQLMVTEHEKALEEELERQNVVVGAVWAVTDKELVVKLDSPIPMKAGMNLVVMGETLRATVEVKEVDDGLMRCRISNRLQVIEVGDKVVRLKLKR